jgi:hypothetical protein
MWRQRHWSGRALAVVAVLAVAGCTAIDDPGVPPQGSDASQSPPACYPAGMPSIAIQCTNADEWYTLTGSGPVPVPPEGLAALHEQILERVRRGGGAVASR